MSGPEDRRRIAEAYIASLSVPNRPPRPRQASHHVWRDPAHGGALRGGWEVRDTGPDGRDRILVGGLPSRDAAVAWIEQNGEQP